MVDTTSPDTEIPETVTVGPTPAAPEPTEEDLLAEAAAEAAMSDDARRARWQSRRPPIEHLKPGVVTTDGLTLPLFDVGDRIVVERRTPLLRGIPWLETIVGKVRSIDDETGIVTIYDEAGDARIPPVRYVSFKDMYHEIRLAPAKGNPFDATLAKKAARELAKAAVALGERRGRGRPKGSKNRPKEEIQAEREAYRKMREAKKAKRS